MKKLYKYLLYLLPAVLCFSYYPLIKLGENETMYFELSLPLIWLVIFDVVGISLVMARYRERLFKIILGSVWWWMFPFFVSFSAIWSLNPLRAILTVGVMWLLIFAIVAMYMVRDLLDGEFWERFLRWFWGAALIVCAWCAVQCLLDVAGVPQETSLLCDGCVSQMFGFPHPNGFTMEPQFMGNLLLAPIMVVAWMIMSGRDASKKMWILFLIFLATLFLTMSRGAIYACVVGFCFLSMFLYFRAKKADKKKVCFSILKNIGAFMVAFIFTLNLQGILAASSLTTDTYGDGVAKVLNHLSLGLIDIREKSENQTALQPDDAIDEVFASENQTALESETALVENSEITEGKMDFTENEVVENSDKREAVFDGYVAESTDTRVRLSKASLAVWRQDFKTMMVGVGIGGAGQALYDKGFSPAPREIVQNEYVSLLLETGIVGVSLFVALMILIIKVALETKMAGLILSLVLAYAVSWLFFSGLPNALQIVLMPGLFICLQLPLRQVRHR